MTLTDALEKIIKSLKLSKTAWEGEGDIMIVDGEPIGMTVRRSSMELDRWLEEYQKKLATKIAESLYLDEEKIVSILFEKYIQCPLEDIEQESDDYYMCKKIAKAIAESKEIIKCKGGEMKDILSRCKCGVFFTANEHRDYYEKAEEWLPNQFQNQKEIDEIPKDVWEEMIKRDTVLCLQFYPDTPIGHYRIYHYDYDELIKIAKQILG